MKLRPYLRWELLLAVTLVGCTSLAPTTPERMAMSPAGETTAIGTAGDNSEGEATRGGRVFMMIQWPAATRRAQAIPEQATSIEITLRKKDGTTLDTSRVQRPAGETPVSTVSFKVDPGVGVIDIEAIARRDDTILARGVRKDVPVRHNTATGVSLTLSSDATLRIRIERQLVIVKDLQHYFQRFSHWVSYPTSSEARTFIDAATAMFQQAGRDAYDLQRAAGLVSWPEPRSLSTPTGALERWVSSARAGYAVELSGHDPVKVYWPGYAASLDYTPTGATRRLAVGLAPAGATGDQSRAEGHLDVTASWIKEPYLTGAFTGLLDGIGEPATRSVRLFAGERPDWDTITAVSAEARFDPQGQALGTGGQITIDGFANATNSTLVKGLLNLYSYYPPVFPTLNWPTHGFARVEIPSAAATADVRLDTAFSRAVGSATLSLKDNQGNRSTFRTRLEGGITPPTRQYVPFQTGELAVVLEDLSEGLRLEGTLALNLDVPALTVKAKLLDMTSDTLIGTIDYDMPLRNGTFEPYHNDSWPYLVLMDGPDGTPGSSIQLNPGLLTGQTTGYVGVSLY